MVSVAVSPYCELARWALDLAGLEYQERLHAPMLHLPDARRQGGGREVPVLVVAGATLTDARGVVRHLERHASGQFRLFPEEEVARAEAERLLTLFYDGLGAAVRAWAYAHMLPERQVTARLLTTAAPAYERLAMGIVYPAVASGLRRALGLTPTTATDALAQIDAGFAEVDGLLADGRRYLVGERLTVADVAFAALTAPAVLPQGFGGVQPIVSQLPPAMRREVERLGETAAGRYARRLYAEDRPRPGGAAVLPRRGWRDAVTTVLTDPAVLRPVFAVLRRVRPVLGLGKYVIVTGHREVLEVLERDADFTVAEINGPRMERWSGRFILGMDRGEDYERERTALESAVREDDLERVRAFAADTAAELLEAARPEGRLDVVGGYARVAATRLVASYFGVPGPDEATTMGWMRAFFDAVFLDGSSRARVIADRAAAEEGPYVAALVAERRAAVVAGRSTPDDVLTRLVRMGEGHTWLDDGAVGRNVNGLIVGAVDTTSKFVTHAVDELLRRPDTLSAARSAALAGDMDAVRRYAWEAVRFRPHHQAVARWSRHGTTLGARAAAVAPGRVVVAMTMSAMFDAVAFPQPGRFRSDRSVEAYLHFNHGLHTCFGARINAVQLPELVGALVRLPGLRRAQGREGLIAYDGPFPDRLVVELD